MISDYTLLYDSRTMVALIGSFKAFITLKQHLNGVNDNDDNIGEIHQFFNQEITSKSLLVSIKTTLLIVTGTQTSLKYVIDQFFEHTNPNKLSSYNYNYVPTIAIASHQLKFTSNPFTCKYTRGKHNIVFSAQKNCYGLKNFLKVF